MFFEFQLSIGALGAVVRNQLRSLASCYSSSFPFQGDTLLINRVLVLDNTSLRREADLFTVRTPTGTTPVNGNKCVLVQPLRFEFVTEADVRTSGPAAAPVKYSPSVDVLVDIIAFSDGATAFLQLSIDGLDFGALGPLVDQPTRDAIVKSLQDEFGTVARAIDMVALQSLMPGLPIVATNAGATTTAAGDVLMLRVEINGTADPVGHWTAFYNTYDTNLLGARNWGLLIDKDLLIAGIKEKLGTSLAASANKFSLDTGPAVGWKPTRPGFDISFSGEVIDACTCAWGELDVNVDVLSTVTLSVPIPDVLRTRVHTTYDADNTETICCALTAGLFWPVVGLIYLNKEKINFGEYLLGYLAGPVGVFIAVCVIAGNQSVVTSLDANCQKVNDETVQCDQPTILSFGALGGTYRVEAITGIAPGAVLAGSATITPLKDPVVKVTVSEFTWVLRGRCSQGFHRELEGQIGLSNTMPGSILRLCPVTVLHDPAHVFHVDVEGTTITITVTLNQAYLSAPYPCQILVPTNAGVRIITLAEAKEITPEREHELAMQLPLLMANCIYPEKDYRWSDPDPDPFRIPIDRLWQIVVSRMLPGQRVEVLDGDQRVLATATATPRGIAHATVWHAGAQRELVLRMLDGAPRPTGPAAAEEAARQVSVRLVQLEPVARFALRGELESVRFKLDDGRTLLALITAEGEWIYDVRRPEAPSLLRATLADRASRPVEAPAGRGAAHRDRLVFGPGDAEVTLHRSDGATHRISLGSLPAGPVSRAVPATVPGVRHAVAVMSAAGDTRVVDVSEPNRPRELASYPARPWFVDAHRSRSLVARVSDDARSVLLYRVRKTVDV